MPIDISAAPSMGSGTPTRVFTIETPTGQKLDIEAPDEATALRGAQQWHTQNTPSGAIAGLQQGVFDLIKGDSQTSQYALGTSGSAQGVADAIAPKNYKPAEILGRDSHWYDPTSYNWNQVPQKLAEMAPGVAQDLAVGRTAAKLSPAVGLAAGLGSFAYRTFGPEAKAAAYARTNDPDATPNSDDKTRAAAVTAAQALPQAIGLGRFIPGMTAPAKGIGDAIGKYATTVGLEGAAGAGANALGQAAQTVGTPGGLKVDPNQVAEAGVSQGIGGAALAGARVPVAAIDAAKYHAFSGALQEASANFANRVSDAAGGRNLGNTSVGYDAVNKAASAVKSELGTAAKGITTTLPTDALNILDNAQKGKLPTVKDYSTLSDALQNDPAGPAVINLVREAHAAELVKGSGNYGDGKFTGGIGPALAKVTGLSGHNTARSMLAALAVEHMGTHMFAASPAVVGVGLAGLAAARGISAVTGSHSPAQRFVNKFGDDTGVSRAAPIPAPASPAVGPTGPAIPLLRQPWNAPANQQSPQGLQQLAVQAAPLLRKLAATQGPNAPNTLPAGFAGMLSNPGNSSPPNPIAKPAAPILDPQVAQGMTAASALRKAVPQPTDVPKQAQGPNGNSSGTVAEVPVPPNLMHTKVGPADFAIAHQAAEQFKQATNVPEIVAARYYDSTAQRQARIRDRLMQLSADPSFPADNLELGTALDKVREQRTREALSAHIDDVTSTLPPKVANTIRSYFGPTWAKSVWNPTKIKK